MIKIKIPADQQRRIEKASTLAELQGVRDMLLNQIRLAVEEKASDKLAANEKRAKSPYNYYIVSNAMRDALGDDLVIPPFPDPSYYQKVFHYAKINGLNEERARQLAARVKQTRLRPPYQLTFLLSQAGPIMDGFFDVGADRAPQRGRGNPIQHAYRSEPLTASLPRLPED